jgi:hypothetical protein
MEAKRGDNRGEDLHARVICTGRAIEQEDSVAGNTCFSRDDASFFSLGASLPAREAWRQAVNATTG